MIKKAIVGIFTVLCLSSTIVNSRKDETCDTTVDCVFSIGKNCRPAHYLNEFNLRFQASPFDWMMKYSLDEVINQMRNNYNSFFEEIEDLTGKNSKSAYRVVDDKNGRTRSLHHFPMKKSAKEHLPIFRSMMQERGKKVDSILNGAASIGFLYESDNDNSDALIEFGTKINELYPKKKVTIFNIVNAVPSDEASEGSCDLKNVNENLTIIKIQFNDNLFDKEGNKLWKGNKEKWHKYVKPRILPSKELIDRCKKEDKPRTT